MPRRKSENQAASVHDLVQTAAEAQRAKANEDGERLISAAECLARINPVFKDLAAYMLASDLPYSEIGHLFEDVAQDPELTQEAYDTVTGKVVDFHRRIRHDEIG